MTADSPADSPAEFPAQSAARSPAEHDIAAHYAALRLASPATGALVLLQVGSQATAVAIGSGPQPDALLVLDLGTERTGRALFRHDPPTEAQMEDAIQQVEDEVIRARRFGQSGAPLYCADAMARTVAMLDAPGAAGQPLTLSQQAIERVFNRLVARIGGRPASQDPIPTDAGFCAGLLILREFVHHLQFDAVTIPALPPPMPASQ